MRRNLTHVAGPGRHRGPGMTGRPRGSAALLLPMALNLACTPADSPPDAPPIAVEPALDGSTSFTPARPSWNRYHTHAQTLAILEAYQARFPDFTRLDTIGRSFGGQPLVVMEITNRATGPAHEKPAIYLDGGIHAQELTASEVVLYVMDHLLAGAGEDGRITHLLDTRAFYLHPKVNPAGSDLVLLEDQWLRSTPRPADLNRDGVPDSDPPTDLDGDGRILQMRIPHPEGTHVADPADPRIMRPRAAGDPAPYYRLAREGIDADGDGEIASDGIGGSDMNRNFPYNWAPLHQQPGAYNFPLSEPETWALANFVNNHPNITQIIHGHTSGGFIYRLPSASNPADFDATDLALIRALGDVYTADTGRPVIPSATDPVDHRYGTFISFGYFAYGVIGWVPEYWPGPSSWVPDHDGTGEVTEADWHRANDERFQGAYFTEWTPFEHPQLGTVEIGGWHTKYWNQNPPHPLLEEELRTQVPWILEMAERTPLLRLSEPAFREMEDGRVEVSATVTNEGWLATHLTQRGAEGRAGPGGELEDPVIPFPLAVLEVEGGAVLSGNGRTRLPHLAGSNPHTTATSSRSHTVRWVVERDPESGGTDSDLKVTVTIHSTKGGTVRRVGSF